MKKFFVFVILSSLTVISFAQKKRITRGEYIETYVQIAIKEMQRVGIPASITLAQACLESDNGNSALSLEGNNHFGIKCHSTWAGKTMKMDDDAKGECFRVYPQALDSYIDHSEFLKNGQRYSELFTLQVSDYKAWAYGLKKAGYATNPDYPQLLIRIIEDNELFKYDNPLALNVAINTQGENLQKAISTIFEGKAPEPTSPRPNPTDNKSIKTKYGREIFKNNGVEFVVLQANESIFMLSKKFTIPVWKIFYYNDFKPGHVVAAGEIIYLGVKKNKAEKPYVSHKVAKGETFHTISQLYGVKVSQLVRLNKANRENILKEGTNIFIRKNVILFE